MRKNLRVLAVRSAYLLQIQKLSALFFPQTSFQHPHDQRLGIELELVTGGCGLPPGVEAGRPLFERGRVPVETPVAVLQVLPVVLGEQRVKERVNTTVAVGQTRDQVVDAGVCLRGQAKGLGMVQR